MTPVTTERIVRSSLAAILHGPGEIESRLEAVLAQLGQLTPNEKKRILQRLQPRLMRALRQRTATVSYAGNLDQEIIAKIETFAKDNGILFHQKIENKGLLAGFTLQMGDDRQDYSLVARLRQFNKA